MDEKQPEQAETVELPDGDERVINEDGIEIHHKAARNLTAEKEEEKLREKIRTQKEKQAVYGKVLKAKKGLADSDSEDDVDAWLEKSRREAAKYDELDAALEDSAIIVKKPKKRPTTSRKDEIDLSTSGLVVGHSREAFAGGKETILVLQDKGKLLGCPDCVQECWTRMATRC